MVIKVIIQLQAFLLENEHGLKTGTGKTEDISSSKAESATHSESKAASTTNAPQDTFQLLQEKHSCQRSGGNQANEEMVAEFD